MMHEFIAMSKGYKSRIMKAFVRTQRMQGAFNAQPKIRTAHSEMHLEQIAHGFGITRYNKKKGYSNGR